MLRFVWVALLTVSTFGCAGQRVVAPFNALDIGQPPIRIGVTELEISPSRILPKRTLFEENLEFYLHRTVSLELMTARQIGIHLESGRLQFAILSPTAYADIEPLNCASILAVPLNNDGKTSSRGLIVVSAHSTARKLEELKGHRIHFLPYHDVLNEAALGALLDAGVKVREGELPEPDSSLDALHEGSEDVVRDVLGDEGSAGVISESAYASWKPVSSPGNTVVSQDQIRIIARTVSVPEGPIVCSRQTSAELSSKVSQYLLNVAPERPMILSSLGCKGFSASIQPKDFEPYIALHRRLYPQSLTPAASQPGDVESQP